MTALLPYYLATVKGWGHYDDKDAFELVPRLGGIHGGGAQTNTHTYIHTYIQTNIHLLYAHTHQQPPTYMHTFDTYTQHTTVHLLTYPLTSF